MLNPHSLRYAAPRYSADPLQAVAGGSGRDSDAPMGGGGGQSGLDSGDHERWRPYTLALLTASLVCSYMDRQVRNPGRARDLA